MTAIIALQSSKDGGESFNIVAFIVSDSVISDITSLGGLPHYTATIVDPDMWCNFITLVSE